MLRKILVRFALKILRAEVVDQINYQPAQQFFTEQLVTLEKVAVIVIDADGDNKNQFAQLWQEIKRPFLISSLTLSKLVIQAETKANALTIALGELVDEVVDEIKKGTILNKTA